MVLYSLNDFIEPQNSYIELQKSMTGQSTLATENSFSINNLALHRIFLNENIKLRVLLTWQRSRMFLIKTQSRRNRLQYTNTLYEVVSGDAFSLSDYQCH